MLLCYFYGFCELLLDPRARNSYTFDSYTVFSTFHFSDDFLDFASVFVATDSEKVLSVSKSEVEESEPADGLSESSSFWVSVLKGGVEAILTFSG